MYEARLGLNGAAIRSVLNRDVAITKNGNIITLDCDNLTLEEKETLDKELSRQLGSGITLTEISRTREV
jgi:ribose 5-phosphate isomerase